MFEIEDIALNVVKKTNRKNYEELISLDQFKSQIPDNKYKSWYFSLINRAVDRKLDCYVEKHHIIPKCLGGNDCAYNLVKLTPEEHYIMHQILVKLFPNNRKLVHAAILMTSKSYSLNRLGNKSYGWLRRKHSECLKGHEVSESVRKRLSDFRTGLKVGPHSEETKLKIKLGSLGKTIPENTRKAVAEANRNRVVSEEIRRKMSESRKGKIHSEESRLKRSVSMKAFIAAKKNEASV